MYRLCVLVLACTSKCVCVEYSREEAGYPVGLLSSCPGSEKPLSIPRKILKQLHFIVQGPNSGLPRRRYHYESAVSGISNDPRIDFRRKTLIFASGYLDSANFPIASIVSSSYVALGYNVILLDTNRFTTMIYSRASRMTRPVGKYVAEVLAKLTLQGLEPSRTELLGLSLGGHTVGFIAKHYRQFTAKNISRITALDPSGPCFRNLPPKDRLDASDADFVDVIATNIDGFGMATPVGHANFYVNGGEYQPADVPWLPCTIMCSHIRAFSIWIVSLVHSEKFVAMKCDSVQQARDNRCYDRVPLETNVLGPNANRQAGGVFYLATRYAFPYYLGRKGLKKEYRVWDVIAKELGY